MKRPLALHLAAAACLAALPAAAQDFASRFSFSGYGTVGAAHSDIDTADYLADAFRPDGPGHSRAWSAKVDTRLGAQASAYLTPQLSAVVQVLARQQYDDSFTPRVEWANVKWQVTPELSVRAGRVVLPVFMVTDSRHVGYANPWVRPPVEVYSLVPVTSNDGMDATWRLPVGEVSNTLQVTAGRSDSRFPTASGFDAGTAEARGLVEVSDTVEVGPLTTRVSLGRARLTIAALRPLFDAFRQFGPPGEAIADRYEVDDRRVTFVGFGANYDPGAWFLGGELARFDTHSVVGKKTAYYVSGGARFGKATPYATYARVRADSPTSDPGLPLAGLPAAALPSATLLNATLNRQLAATPLQRTLSVGVRWDFMRNAALKLQYDRVTVGGSSHGTFGNVQPGFRLGGRAAIFSAVVDFVF